MLHKRIRLAAHAYAVEGAICSVTIGLRDRAPRFADARFAAAAVEVLGERAAQMGVQVFAYCFMPDHVHLLLAPSVRCDVITFVGQFKNLAQRRFWELGGRGTIWQKSFWDHFLRAEEDLVVAVEYILNNPVRAGLVEHWRDYRFAGSMVFRH